MIRSYRDTDLEAVIRLLQLNTPQYFALAEEKELRNYLTDEKEDYYVVELNHELVAAGGINYNVDSKDSVRIAWDIVHPTQQRQGIGNQLLAYRIKQIENKKVYSEIIVRTSQLAFRFYEQNGFTLTAIEKDYWAMGFDLYLMIKKLD